MYGITPLHHASRTNSREVAVDLLQRGADVNAVDRGGYTPLHRAAENNSEEVAAELFQRGADVHTVSGYDDTPLHLAAENNSKKVAADLIQHGADVNAVGGGGDTPLHRAAYNNSKEVAADLLQRGADVNAVDWDGDTPLHHAAYNNSKEVAAELLQRGADVNAVGEGGDTPLHRAAYHNSKEFAADLLQRGANVNAVDWDGDTPLHHAAYNSSKEVAAELLQRGADVNAVGEGGDTPLHRAAYNNSKEFAADLLQRGANVNAVDRDGDSPLHHAAYKNRKEFAAELLQRGADVNAVGGGGDTSLHRAAYNNSKEFAADLLERGADVNAVNGDGDTPLHRAAYHNSKEVAADLLQRGADINAVNGDGDTALHHAAYNNSKKVAADLLQRGANFIALNAIGDTPLDVASKSNKNDVFIDTCKKFEITFFLMNKRGETALHLVASKCITQIMLPHILNNTKQVGQINCPLRFPDYSSDLLVNVRDINSNTPLHRWSMVSRKSLPRRVIEDEITKCGKRLLDMGALVNARNSKDQTPLHVACSWKAVDVLLENGAHPNVTDMYNGDTSLIARVKSLKDSPNQIYEDFSLRGNNNNNNYERHISSIAEWKNIISKGMSPWIANSRGETVLGVLIEKSSFLLTQALISVLKHMDETDKKHSNGETILHVICLSVADELQSVIDDLLKSHAKVNVANTKNQTPLHLVCRKLAAIRQEEVDFSNSMHFWIARRLLAHGADPKLQDSNGASCFDIAETVPELRDLLNKPFDLSAIPPLMKWSDPKSEKHRGKIAQVVRNQKSSQIDCYHYHSEAIGSGAFGYVFAGVDERNGREIAMKRIEKQRLLHGPENRREIDNLVKLRDCEEIVKYLGHQEDTHFAYLILDLMEGTLEEYLDKTPRDTSLDPTLCQDVVNGLQYLHRNKILHRDIKPENILYKFSWRICLKLSDFGLSTKPVLNKTLSVMHTNAGTRNWMAPELLRATSVLPHSDASDVFSYGLVIHFLLADKRHPFTEPSTLSKSDIIIQNETERNIFYYQPFLYSELSPEARDLIEKLLLKDQSKRLNTGQ